MNEGCSPCACLVPGACDQLSRPSFLWPGVVILILILVVLVFLRRKKLIRIKFEVLLAGWIVLALIFSVMVYFKTETVGELTRRAAGQCQISGNPTCEF